MSPPSPICPSLKSFNPTFLGRPIPCDAVTKSPRFLIRLRKFSAFFFNKISYRSSRITFYLSSIISRFSLAIAIYDSSYDVSYICTNTLAIENIKPMNQNKQALYKALTGSILVRNLIRESMCRLSKNQYSKYPSLDKIFRVFL